MGVGGDTASPEKYTGDCWDGLTVLVTYKIRYFTIKTRKVATAVMS